MKKVPHRIDNPAPNILRFPIPIGAMANIGMSAGLTFAGRAYDDSALLRFAAAFESIGGVRAWCHRVRRRCRAVNSTTGLARKASIPSLYRW